MFFFFAKPFLGVIFYFVLTSVTLPLDEKKKKKTCLPGNSIELSLQAAATRPATRRPKPISLVTEAAALGTVRTDNSINRAEIRKPKSPERAPSENV